MQIQLKKKKKGEGEGMRCGWRVNEFNGEPRGKCRRPLFCVENAIIYACAGGFL